MEGRLFNIQKFSLHDGPGIRTTVFFKGCNLHCRWCANPESQSAAIQNTLDRQKCTGCGICVAACPNGARRMEGVFPVTDPALCTGCGSCAAACPVGAAGAEGYTMTANAVLETVRKDKVFYDGSGGGVTFSGGEVLLQLPFATELARLLRKEGIHVAAETAGAVPETVFSAFLQEVDLVLMDLKHYDSAAHKAGTGVGNGQILGNLRLLRRSGKPFVLRIPVIPGFNDSLEDALGFAKTLKDLDIWEAELLPFHRLGAKKYALLGREYDYENQPSLRAEDLEAFSQTLTGQGIRVIR